MPQLDAVRGKFLLAVPKSTKREETSSYPNTVHRSHNPPTIRQFHVLTFWCPGNHCRLQEATAPGQEIVLPVITFDLTNTTC